ncbi:MAG: hypothetical protein ACR2FM_02285 [Candidatus Saccharimonadales bacterium]
MASRAFYKRGITVVFAGVCVFTLTIANATSFAATEQSAYRMLANLDNNNPTFIQHNPGSGDDTIGAAVIDPVTGSFFMAGHNTTWVIQKRTEADGSLVPAFGTSGQVLEDVASSTSEQIGAIATDPNNGAIYVGGYDRVPGTANSQWRIEKRDYVTGALVSGFGTSGVVSSNPTAGDDIINSIVLDTAGGYVYIAGYDSAGGNQQRIEKRSMTNGALVTGFATGGVYTLNPSNQDDRIRAIDLDPTAQYIYVAGSDEGNGNTAWRLDKLRASDAAPCTAANCGVLFGTAGSYNSNPSVRADTITSLQVDDAGGAIYMAGYDGVIANNNQQWRIEKIDLNTGALINAFGTSGAVTSNPSSNNEEITDIALDGAGGFIFIIGSDNTSADMRWRVEKRQRSSGALVTAFGTGGVVTSNPSANNDTPASVLIDVDRNLVYAVGMDRVLGNANSQWRIEQYQSDDGGYWLGSTNTAGLASSGVTFRIRMLIHSTTNLLAASATQFKLQYSPKTGTCDTGFVGETYVDVTTSSGEILYHDNPTQADATAALALPGDPLHGTDTNILETIEELNNFTNPVNINAGQDGLWDFAVKDFNAFGAYCFRAVNSDGTVLDTYTVVPELTFCRDDPKTESVLRHGAYFCEGTERAYFWAKD